MRTKIKAAGNLFTASPRGCGWGKGKIDGRRDLLEQLKLAFPRKKTNKRRLLHASRSTCYRLEAYATLISTCITKHNVFKTIRALPTL